MATVSFVGSTKRVLRRVIKERGVEPTLEAEEALHSLPDTFREWIEQHRHSGSMSVRR